MDKSQTNSLFSNNLMWYCITWWKITCWKNSGVYHKHIIIVIFHSIWNWNLWNVFFFCQKLINCLRIYWICSVNNLRKTDCFGLKLRNILRSLVNLNDPIKSCNGLLNGSYVISLFPFNNMEKEHSKYSNHYFKRTSTIWKP